MIAATSFVISSVMYPNAGYDPLKSFDAVAFLARSPQVLVIPPDVPAKTMQEFVAYAKANPGKLNFGFGLGTLPQILGELLQGGDQERHRQHSLQGRRAGDHRHARRPHPHEFRPAAVGAAAGPAGKFRTLAVTTDDALSRDAGRADHEGKRTAGTGDQLYGRALWRRPARRSRSSNAQRRVSTRR